MLTILKEQNGKDLIIKLDGRLDTLSSPDLEKELESCITGITKLVFDMRALTYISSAGLRVILMAQKTMNRQGSMVVTGVSSIIMEIFEVTGFVDILTIQ